MLLSAPFLLRHLGASQYGVWLLAGATVSSGGIVSGSFGDAAIKNMLESVAAGRTGKVSHVLCAT